MPSAILLGQQFRGDEAILHRLTHDSDGTPRRYYTESHLIALCEGWPESETLEQIVESIRQRQLDDQDTVQDNTRRASWSATFALLSSKGRSESIRDTILFLLSRYPLPVESEFSFNGSYILRVVGRRVHTDEPLAVSLWEELESTKNPSAKIVLATLLFGSATHGKQVAQWCNEEIERQLSTESVPEVGFDWASYQRRPVVHALLDLLTQTR